MKNALLFFIMLTIFNQESKSQEIKDWANFGKYEKENTSVKPGTIVFMGNSITQGWRSQRPDFFETNNFTGRGISGQTTMEMLVRFRRDVIDLKPKAVVIMAGTNDIAQNQGYISLENTFGNIVSMAELAKVNHIKVVICSVLPAFQFNWRKEVEPADKIISLNKMLQEYATANGIAFVDFHLKLKDARNGLPERYAKDGVHPNVEAYEIMENILKPVLEKL